MHHARRFTGRRGALGMLLALLVVAGQVRAEDVDISFASAEEAAAALFEAMAKDDPASARSLLGEVDEELLSSGDPIQDKNDRKKVVAAYQKVHKFVVEEDGSTTIEIGDDAWPFPVPLVQSGGRWRFDGMKGAQELAFRRIGRNELGAIAVCRGIVDAQTEYAAVGHDGDKPGIYALKLISDEGLENGLYWPTGEGEEPSPAGEFIAAAAGEGYTRGQGRTPYHGYFFRLLYAQGPNAAGGAREYFKQGLLTEGFAVIAWPANYGSGGIMTFMVNQDGVVFQKDLGDSTSTVVETIDVFDPDDTWEAVVEPSI